MLDGLDEGQIHAHSTFIRSCWVCQEAKVADVEARTQWSRDREWDALLLEVFSGVCAESGNPAPSKEKMLELRVQIEARTWEAAAVECEGHSLLVSDRRHADTLRKMAVTLRARAATRKE